MKLNNPSSRVQSAQNAVHPRLLEQVRRHLNSSWRQAPQPPTVEAFAAVAPLVSGSGKKIILDSGCGTGESTRQIAAHYPESLVIGIDKSAARLEKVSSGPFPCIEDNIFWLRAELASFWQLAHAAGWKLQRHYLLYPNPWPKPGHLQRRWHAHPVFPILLKLGGRLELRCNWQIYAEEFAIAVKTASGFEAQLEPVEEGPVTTPFERKYRASGHDLFRVVIPDL